MGAAVSDIIYAAITGFGMSFVMDFISNDAEPFLSADIGSLLLLCFGFYTYRSDPTKKMHQSGQQKGTVWYNTWTAFLVTFSNPLIIFLFLAMYAQFAFVLPDHPFEMIVGFLSIVGGALLWWWGLTWLVDKIRHEVRRERHQDYQSGHWRGGDYRQCDYAVRHNDQPAELLLKTGAIVYHIK